MKKGRFSFPAAHSGEYILEAQIDGYKIAPSFVDVERGKQYFETQALLEPTSTVEVSSITSAPDGMWLTSYAEARKASIQQKKPIFIDFTGSDWCEWCALFNNEVLSTPSFLAYAKNNLILLRVDLPSRKETAAPKNLVRINN